MADDEHAVLLNRWRRYGFIADGDLPGSVAEATLTCLALLGRLIPGRKDQPSEDLIDACGPNAWIVRLARLVVAEAYVREEKAKGWASSFGSPS